MQFDSFHHRRRHPRSLRPALAFDPAGRVPDRARVQPRRPRPRHEPARRHHRRRPRSQTPRARLQVPPSPPFALDDVHLLPDGRVRLDLPRKGRFVDLTLQQFIAKLAALVPRPRANLVHYAGCFANRHHLRSRIVPKPDVVALPPVQLRLFDFAGKPLLPSPALDLDAPRMHRRSWAHLLARVFASDVTTCPCGGRLKIVEVVLDPDSIALHLHGARAPPRPSPPGQLSLLPT